jgi:hypothetical protein
MNERIGKLAEQAGLLGPSSRVGNSHDATEKFAELIVKECMKLNSKELSITAIERLLPLYREHFGLEDQEHFEVDDEE